jgi:hypothetical protein
LFWNSKLFTEIKVGKTTIHYGLVVNAKKRRVTATGSVVKMDFCPDVVKISDEFCHSWVDNPNKKEG